jgi:DNA-directed RNA polymerase specialized sigma54-like protein
MINGIPFRIKTLDQKTNTISNVETIYFATFRKNPKLAELAKAITRKQMDLRIIGKRCEFANEAFNANQDPSQLESLAEAESVVVAERERISDEVLELAHNFITEGLKSAGYLDEDIERIRVYIPMERLVELVQSSKIGAGVKDFF